MHKNATKCNETLSKWCKNKHGASKIIDTFETYHTPNTIILCIMTRVNSANVLYEGLKIGGRGHWMNSKIKISQTRRGLICIENKRGIQLAQSHRWPTSPDPYVLVARSLGSGQVQYKLECLYMISTRISTTSMLDLPKGPWRYQDNGPY
jgi:hypothetical protein